MKKQSLFFILTLFYFNVKSQQNTSLNASEILLALQKLNTVGSVMYVAAHPDDENTRLLGYLANEQKLRTAYLSLTRGDGGQNLIGKEQSELLGLIRTQELLAARKTDGAEQFFTRANDFGFSKNPEETLAIWNKDSILADVVFAIRKFKPDVIICRFPTTGEGGHGHHTASAILALEAFDAAADPSKYTQQLKQVTVWQAKRIFWNTFNFGTTNTTSPDQLKIDVGVFNPLLGKSYGEIAAESRSMHKSQGFGSAKQRGSNIEYFKLLKGDSLKSDLFEGIDRSWNRLKSAEKMGTLITACIKNFNPLFPEKSISELITIYKQLQTVDEKNALTKQWKLKKIEDLETLITACAGLWVEANTVDYIGIPGENVKINAQVVKRNNVDVKLNTISYLHQTDTSLTLNLKTNELFSFKHTEKLPSTLSYSNPYWLKEPHTIGLYRVDDPLLIGEPENKSMTSVVFDINVQGLPLKIERNLVYKYTDPVKGEVYRPFELLPPATINSAEQVVLFSDSTKKMVQFIVKANTANTIGKIDVKATDGWKVSVQHPEFKLANKGDEVIIDALVSSNKNATIGKLQATLTINNEVYNKSIKRIEYDHIPYEFILSDAETKLVNVDIKKTGTTIGYISGAGDDIPTCLKLIGYNVTILTDELLTNDDLSKYDAIVTGIRAYNTNERLQIHYAKLMDYVKNGGNLVVQYNTNNRIGPVMAKIGPYPFTISRNRVTDENSTVKFINDKSSVLNYPNKITINDFDGWIQERGIYFATELDKNYETVFEMNDASEKGNDGSLIIAKYGKGNFVYTGLSFFRELPAGIPGAYRLFVNLLSMQKR